MVSTRSSRSITEGHSEQSICHGGSYSVEQREQRIEGAVSMATLRERRKSQNARRLASYAKSIV